MRVLLIITILAVLILAYSSYFRRNCHKKVYIDLNFDNKRATVDDIITLNITVENKKFLIIPVFRLEILIPHYLEVIDEDFDVSLVPVNDNYYSYTVVSSLICYQRLRKKVHFKVKKRGYYKLKNNIVYIDILGLAEVRSVSEQVTELFVKPCGDKNIELTNNSTTLQGNDIVKRWLAHDPVFFLGVRKYQMGDSYKDIDWKSTAKLGELQVKNYEYTSDISAMIFLDIYSVDNNNLNNGQFIEESIILSSCIIEEFYKNKYPVGFGTNALMSNYSKSIVMPSSGYDNVIMINDMLTCMEYQTYDYFYKYFNKYIYLLSPNSILVFIKYEMTQYIYDLVNMLASNAYNFKIELFLYKDNGIKIKNENINVKYFEKEHKNG